MSKSEFVKLEDVWKAYKNVQAVRGVSFTINKNELVTLLGPSGCGKTTTLRLIAGLEYPDKGEIIIDGKIVSSPEKNIFVPPHKRGIGMIFQNYAVWPHMTVYDNIAYGLRLMKLSKEEIDKRVKEVLEMLSLAGLERRYPTQLSGGQQQRVALARALAARPSLLLLDEPLSNLDAKLRERMRFEIRNIVKRFGLTGIYVTHDQAEALVISDRIIVMNNGVIEQIGKPEEVYRTPANRFVADFIGVANFIPIRIKKITENFQAIAEMQDGTLIKCIASSRLKENDPAYLMIRPENIILTKQPLYNENTLMVKVAYRVYLGNITYYWVRYNDYELRVQVLDEHIADEGESVYLHIKSDKAIALPG
ncbi:MAG: ABC transporter ATP-binding protein [Infirmifilum sp.]|jgi:iron(III) transport system ATP-binding protein|uniref:ABC transporter ATP-binding protein n=1 Tax=Infirmifilum TaxID=2856573 RepID=UPI003C7155C5